LLDEEDKKELEMIKQIKTKTPVKPKPIMPQSDSNQPINASD